MNPLNQSQLPISISDEIKSQPQKQELKINVNDRLTGKVHIGKFSQKMTNDQSENEGFNRKNSMIPSIKFRAQKFDQLKACIEQGLNKNSKERLAPKTSQSSKRPKINGLNQTSREYSYQKSTFLQNQKYMNADQASKINSINSKFKISPRDNKFKSSININEYTKNHAYQEILSQNQDSILFTNRGLLDNANLTYHQNISNYNISKTLNSNEYQSNFGQMQDQVMINPLSPVSNFRQNQQKEFDITNFKYSYGKARADIAQIKNKKIRTNLLPNQLIQTCRDKFSDFFNNEKVQMVTEQQVIDGFSKFQVLFDPEKVKEIQAQVDKINQKNEKAQKMQEQIKKQEQKLSEKIENGENKFEQENLLEYVELEANNKIKQKQGEQIPTYMLATMIKGLDQAKNIKGIENQNHVKKINKTIFNLEQHEIQIIGDLYKQHFLTKNDNEPPESIQKPDVSLKDSQIIKNQLIQFTQTNLINEDPSNLISNDSKNILDNYSIQGKKEANKENSQKVLKLPNIQLKQSLNTGLQSPIDQFTNSKLIEKMTIHEDLEDRKIAKKDKKHIMYIPNNLGKSHLDLDIALKSIFTNQGSQSSVSPRGRNKFSWFNTQENTQEKEPSQIQLNGFLNGNQKNNCYGNHMHSKECSKVKDIDLAQLQSVAFQFMVVQKPDKDQNQQQDANIKASFYPNSKLTYELQQNLETNDLVRKIMNIPNNKIQKIYEKRIDDYLKDKSIREDILPGQYLDDDYKFEDNLNRIIQGINHKTSTSKEENLKRILFKIGIRDQLQKISKNKKYRKTIKKENTEIQTDNKIDMGEIDEASEISTEQEIIENNQFDLYKQSFDNQNNIQILKSQINQKGNEKDYDPNNPQINNKFGYRKSVQLKNCINLNQGNQKTIQTNDKIESKKKSTSNMYRKSKNNSNMDLEDSINTRLVHTRQTSSNYALPLYNSQENYQSKDLNTSKKVQPSKEITIQMNNNMPSHINSEHSQIFESAQTLKKSTKTHSVSHTPKSQKNIKMSYNIQQKKSQNGLTKLNLKDNSPKKSGMKENPSPLSNESIKYLSAKENMLNQKYQNRLIQEQLKSQQQFEMNVFELIKVQQELKRRQEQGFNPKLVWKSPFEHRESLKQNQRDTLKQKEVKNIEKIYQSDFQRKVQIEFNKWSFTELYKRQLQLAALAQQYQLKYSLITNQNLIKLQNVRQNIKDQRKANQKPNESFSDEISPIKIRFLDNKYNDNQQQLSNSMISEHKNSENKNVIGNVVIPLVGIEENSSSIQENPQNQTKYREGFISQEQADQYMLMESSQDPNFSKNGIDLVSQSKISATSDELKNIDEMLDTNQFSINADTVDGFTPQRYRSPRKTIEIQIKQQNRDENIQQQDDQYQIRDNMVPAIFNNQVKVNPNEKGDKKQTDGKIGDHQASFLKLQFSQRSKRSQFSKEDNQDLINTFNEERDLLSSDRMKSKQSRGNFSNKKVPLIKSREREAAELNNVVLELGNVKIQKYPQNFLQKVRGTLTRGGIQRRNDIINYHAITPVTQMMDQTDIIEQHSSLNPTLVHNHEMHGDKKINKNLLNVVIQTKKGDKIENVFQSKKVSQTSIEEMGSTESKRLNKQILEISELKNTDILAASLNQSKVPRLNVKKSINQEDGKKIVLKQKKFVVGEDLMHLMTFRKKKNKNKSSSPPNFNTWKITNKVTDLKNTRPKLF